MHLARFPRVRLFPTPTPLEPLTNLSRHLGGPEIWIKRDDLTGDQMERIGRRLQKSGKRALSPLVRKLWREQNGTAIYRYTCMLDFFDASAWMDQLIQITLKRTDLEEDGKLALLDFGMVGRPLFLSLALEEPSGVEDLDRVGDSGGDGLQGRSPSQ